MAHLSPKTFFTGFSWRWHLSFPEPLAVRWQWGRPQPTPCRRRCRRECPRGTVLSDCTRSETVRCRCEPKDLARLLPLLLKNYGRNTFYRGITPNAIRRKLMFSRVGGCPEGTRPHGCTKSLPPICSCTPDGLDTLLDWWENQHPYNLYNTSSTFPPIVPF